MAKKRKKRQIKPETLELVQNCPLGECEARKRCWMPDNCWAKPGHDPTIPIKLARLPKSYPDDSPFEEGWLDEDD